MNTEIAIEHTFDVEKIRADFPILQREIYGKPLVYLDNAATTQKPQSVIDATSRYYSELNANIHRGVHYLSQKATDEYEGARKRIQRFLNATSEREIIFTRGCTESVNLVAATYGRKFLKEGDEIIISEMEHHSNIVPWQMLAEEKSLKIRVVPIDDRGDLILEEYEKLFNERTKFVAIVHVSNSLGTVNPVKKLVDIAHSHGVPILIDGAQATPHVKVDVRELDADFYTLSGHKVFGPTGVGVLYGKEKFLKEMPPYQGGGDMIKYVSFEKTMYNDLPFKFEAGTPNIAGGIGLAAALDYVDLVGYEVIYQHEHELLSYCTERLLELPEVTLIGTAREKASVAAFVLKDIHPHDVGTFLDREGVAIRAGHHCTQPVMKRFGIPASNRASFAFYNTKSEIDVLVESVKKVIVMFA
ncbi:MAG: cysteine desulfurase [Bacteroidota bacterium]